MTGKGIVLGFIMAVMDRNNDMIYKYATNCLLNRCNYKVKSNKGKIYQWQKHQLEVVLNKLEFVVVAFEPISPRYPLAGLSWTYI